MRRLVRLQIRLHRVDLLARLLDRLAPRRGVAFVRWLHCHAQHRARVEVHRMLDLVRQVRSAILHLRDLRVGIVRVLPVVVRALVFPRFVELRQILTRRRLDA